MDGLVEKFWNERKAGYQKLLESVDPTIIEETLLNHAAVATHTSTVARFNVELLWTIVHMALLINTFAFASACVALTLRSDRPVVREAP